MVEQLLIQVIIYERPDLEQKRKNTNKQIQVDKMSLQDLEDKTLRIIQDQ